MPDIVNDDDLSALAAEYVLGTLDPDERTRANVLLDVDLTNPDIFKGDELVLAKDTFHIARAKFLWSNSCYELFTVASYAERRTRACLEELEDGTRTAVDVLGNPAASTALAP